jgi:methyl-accepting chemotaxis protein
MKTQNNILTKELFAILISIFFLVLFAFLIGDGYLNLERDKEIYVSNEKDMISDRVNSLLFEWNIFPQDLGNDVLFLSELSSLNSVLKSGPESRQNSISHLKEDFLNYLEGSPAYYQLRYVDENGTEVAGAEFSGNECYSVRGDKVPNEKEDFYFREATRLKKGEVYFSKLDLNVEHGLMENVGTEANPVYVPTLRITTPVFDSFGVNRGVVMLSICVDYFLEDIRLAQRSGDSLFLITQKGYYLAHPDREKEFGFMLGKESSFYDDYPSVPKNFLLDVTKRTFEDERFIFSFKHIYPIPKGAKIYGVDEDYSWILVTVSDKTQLERTTKNLENNYFWFLLVSGFIILIIAVLTILFSKKHSDSGRKK